VEPVSRPNLTLIATASPRGSHG